MRSRAKTLPVPVQDYIREVFFRVLGTQHTSATIVRALRAREATLGPTVRGPIGVKQCIFLLETKPGDLVFGSVHRLFGVVTIVGPVWCTIVIVALGEDENVVAASERVLEDGSGAQVDVGIPARGLVGGRAVKVPDTELANILDFLADGLQGRGG